MLHTDENFSSRVEEAVAELAQRTDAEVVVVVTERSGTYRDLAAAAASVATLVGLLVLMALPHAIHPALVPIDLLMIWCVSAWLANDRRLVRLISTARRRKDQVHRAAAAEFHIEAVHSTPRRTGLLIYVSALEGRVEVVADVGLEARIPRGRWGTAAHEFATDDLEHFLAGLRRVGEVLAEHVPPTEGKQVDLANAPRIRT